MALYKYIHTMREYNILYKLTFVGKPYHEHLNTMLHNIIKNVLVKNILHFFL